MRHGVDAWNWRHDRKRPSERVGRERKLSAGKKNEGIKETKEQEKKRNGREGKLKKGVRRERATGGEEETMKKDKEE